MLIDMQSIFRYKTANFEKLKGNGFEESNGTFTKSIGIIDGQFTLIISIKEGALPTFCVMDNEFEEEYALVHAENAQGGFVCEVRSVCEQILMAIAQNCFDTQVLSAGQTRRIVEGIFLRHAVNPEFLWDDLPDCAIFRRADNRKWFGVLMSVPRGKLGLEGKDNVEIINIKLKPEKIEQLKTQPHFYPSYHMNKTHWITICLDGSIEDGVLLHLIDESYECVANKKKAKVSL